eukprot:10235632-Alexandrium_andersonii.AAC.1
MPQPAGSFDCRPSGGKAQLRSRALGRRGSLARSPAVPRNEPLVAPDGSTPPVGRSVEEPGDCLAC